MASNYPSTESSLLRAGSQINNQGSIKRAELGAWMKARVLPVSHFSTEEELRDSDIQVFRQYQVLRANQFRTSGYRKAQKLQGKSENYAPEALEYLGYLEGSSHYRGTRSETEDIEKLKKIIDQRVVEFRNSCPEEASPKEAINKTPVSPKSLEVQEQIQARIAATAETAQSSEASSEPAEPHSREVPTIEFPAMMLVKKALERQASEKKTPEKKKPSHEELVNKVETVEKELKETEAELQKTYMENRHRISRGEFPKEIQNRIDELTERKKTKTIEHKKARQDYASHINNQINLIEGSFKKEHSLEAVYEERNREALITAAALESLTDKLFENQIYESGHQIELFQYLENSPLSLDQVKEIADAVYSRDIEKVTRLVEDLNLFGKDGYLVDEEIIKDLLADLNSAAKKVKKSEEKLSQISDEKLIRVVRSRLEALESKAITNNDLDKLNLMAGLFLKAQIRSSRKEQNPVTESHFQNYLSKLSDEYSVTDQSSALDYRLGSLYRGLRVTGTIKPEESISGIKHDYQATAELAQQDSGSVQAWTSLIRKDVQDEYSNWAWFNRSADGLGDNTSGESYERMSARVIASPELIKTLDELSSKHRFMYKIPAKETSWSRSDTLTIYFVNENAMSFDEVELKTVSKAAKQEIAKALQPYVFEGDDSRLLGSTIQAEDATAYIGVSFSAQPNEIEIVELVAKAYSVSDKLGEFVLDAAKVNLGDTSFGFKTSVGLVHALRLLLDEVPS